MADGDRNDRMGRWEKKTVTGDVDLVGREELELLATARLPIKRMLRRKEQSMGTTRSWRWVRSVVISVDSGEGAEEALGAPECGANSAGSGIGSESISWVACLDLLGRLGVEMPLVKEEGSAGGWRLIDTRAK